MQTNRLVAVDSNVLLSLAGDREEVIDAWQLIRDRMRPTMLLVPPTVLAEIGAKATEPESALGRLALKALRGMRHRWNLHPVELRPDQEILAARVARQILLRELVPAGEQNDSLIVAESAILDCTLLVSDDSHLDNIDRAALKSLLARFRLNAPLIATPRMLVRKFYR